VLPEVDHRLGFSALEGEFEIDALPVEGEMLP
jgi:hypothetical protein